MIVSNVEHFLYVALWDPESTKFQCYLRPSPGDWRTLKHFNVVLTVFHIDHISQGVGKTVRTTFWCIIVLQSQIEGPEKAHNYGTDWGQIFRTFSPQLENKDTLKYSFDSFAHTLTCVVNVEICWNWIEMYQCPPIAEKRSLIALKFNGLRISECNKWGLARYSVHSTTAYYSVFQPFPATCIQFQPNAGYSNLVQPIAAPSTLFQRIPAYSSLFQFIPAYSSIFKPISANSRIFQPIYVYSSPFQPISAYHHCFSSHSLKAAELDWCHWLHTWLQR